MGSFLGTSASLDSLGDYLSAGLQVPPLLEISFRVGSEVILLRVHRAVALPTGFSCSKRMQWNASTFTRVSR